jgi:hypothetical protein
MEHDGLIRKMRGVLEIESREGLDRRMCRCHHTIVRAYQQETQQRWMSPCSGSLQPSHEEPEVVC